MDTGRHAVVRNEVLVHTDLNILVVEDDEDIAQSIADELRHQGHRAVIVRDGSVAMRRIEAEVFDLVISDVRLPGTDGLTIFRRLAQRVPKTPVILMSAYGSISEAVDAVKNDAAHYLAKPFGIEDLLRAVREAEARIGIERVRDRARDDRGGPDPDTGLIGDSPAMHALQQMIRTVAAAEGSVLLTGEVGSGKERVARALHCLGPRSAGPFVSVDCAANAGPLPAAEAQGGTLFLDEVAELSPGVQARLLHLLSEGGEPARGTPALRVIATTSTDLRERVAGGHFRDDLFYRLKQFHLHVPALRERRSDMPKLVDHFLGMAPGRREQPRISARAWAALSAYPFPGNVRELRDAVQHAVAMLGENGGDIDLGHLPEEIRGGASDAAEQSGFVTLISAAKDFERDYLVRALREAGWNKTRAAKLLGISRKTLWQKLRMLGVDAPRRRPDPD
jgi:DNA-binding NtrC family response regulator